MRPLSLLFFIWFLLISNYLFAQLNVQVGEKFLEGKSVKEVFVCVEDNSVWAVDHQGNVYSKLISQNEFTLFQPTQGHVVTGLSGFNANEMYFAAGPKLIQVISGVTSIIAVAFQGVNRINDVAVGYARDWYGRPEIADKDYITIATNKHLYYMIRGSNSAMFQNAYLNAPNENEPDWIITNKGFKVLEYRFKYRSGNCGYEVDRMWEGHSFNYVFYTWMPDQAPFPSNITSTIFATDVISPYFDRSYAGRYNIWGTDQGVYVKTLTGFCAAPVVRRLQGQNINDLEEIFALTPFYKQDYIFAATNNGIYYTPSSIFGKGIDANDFMLFDKVSAFPAMKVNSIAAQTRRDAVFHRYISNIDLYNFLCEKIMWVGTVDGLYKLYLNLEQEKFDNLKFGDFNYNRSMSGVDFNNPTFDICSGEKLSVSARLPSGFDNQMLIKWYKDGIEIPELIGRLSVDLNQAGVYTAKLTALCENITISSVPITLKTNSPEITFSYTSDVNLCAGDRFPLQTKLVSGYSYRWFKDNDVINGATSNSFTPLTTGNYRVEVSSCPSIWTSSITVKVNFSTLPPNVIASQRVDYCIGETVVLKIDNPNNYIIKWFRNEIEQPQYVGLNEISTQTQGNYKVHFVEGNCKAVVFNKDVIFNAKPVVQLNITQPQTLCDGETLTLRVPRQAGETYLWSNGRSGNEIQVAESGDYYVTITSSIGCTTTSETISVTTRPKLILAEPEKQEICIAAKETRELVAPDGYVRYKWNGITGSNKLKVSSPGTYSLEVEDSFGCKASINYQVNLSCEDIIIPNTFSPNGDGINDLWNVSGLENDRDAKISIYARSGEKVYETTGNNPVWDGKIKNVDAPIGVYYYMIKTSVSANILKGSILIIR